MTNIKTATIIGSGVGGLCAAIALRQAGIDAHVYEKADLLGDVGAGLVLWSNAIRALRMLGLADDALHAGATLQRGEISTAAGRVMKRTDLASHLRLYGEPTAAIHRAALSRVLLARLPANAIHLNQKCERVEQDASGTTAHFADGSFTRADLLIGADGIRSAVRGQFFPDVALRYSGYTAWRGVVQTKDESALGITSETWARGARFGIVRMDAERVYWFATANAPAGSLVSQAQRKTTLLALFGGWHSPIPQLLAATPDQAFLQNDIYDIPPMKRWSAGRVTLLGDAAHATTPNMGQGACMAVESAVVLARCLADGASVEAALRDYERIRQPRTAWVTRQSWQLGQIGQIENPLLCAARDAVFSLLPASTMNAQLAQALGGFE
jgi:2-polyprenyl-6-methoxyphenol hydroxylase-like FAD-dependent oxidoreductase